MLVKDNIIQGVKNHHLTLNRKEAVKAAVSFESNENMAKVGADTLKAYKLSFLGKTRLTAMQKAPVFTGKQYQGASLFDKSGTYVEWSKVGWDKLSQEPIDWEKGSQKDISEFLYALSLAETKESTWVRKYNPTNVPEPLATYHSLVSADAKAGHKNNIDTLNNIAAGKDVVHKTPAFLDQQLLDSKTGRLNLEFTIFDTETTGVNNDPNKGPVDRVVQLGAVKVGSDGEVRVNTAVSQFVNPEMHIPEGATAVHHITDEMVKDKPVMGAVLDDFCNKYLKGQLLCAYNAKFDVPMMNNAIDKYNEASAIDITKMPISLALDPFIILQRIHPFVGSAKRLSEQYKYLFGRNMEGAHDALDDVKGTVDALKYCCYYLQKHCNRPLTVKDLLTFQFGGKVEGLDIKLSHSGYDESKNFKQSYRLEAIGVKDFPYGNIISDMTIAKIRPVIGDKNAELIEALSGKLYKSHKNFKEKMVKLGVTGFEKLSADEVMNTVIKESINYKNNEFVEVWMKNTKTDSMVKGNDLPDVEVARKVMKERASQDSKGTGAGRDLSTVLAEMDK